MHDCIVLAAGASSRMGVWKLLLPWKGLTVIETVVDEALAAAARVIVVAGYRADDLVELFSGMDRVLVVVHEGWRKGQVTSLQHGLAEVTTDGFFVTLGDIPGVTSGLYAQLAARRQALPLSPRPRAFRPGTPAHPGHPVLLDAGAQGLIAGLDPGLSLRHVFPELQHEYLQLSPAQIPGDLDHPRDYSPGSWDLGESRGSPRLVAEARQAAERLGFGSTPSPTPPSAP